MKQDFSLPEAHIVRKFAICGMKKSDGKVCFNSNQQESKIIINYFWHKNHILKKFDLFLNNGCLKFDQQNYFFGQQFAYFFDQHDY